MSTGLSHKSSVSGLNGGFKQNEIAVARDEIGAHGIVAFAFADALANENADVARQRRLGIVDQLVLTDEAAQFARERAARVSSAGSFITSSGCTASAGPAREARSGKEEEKLCS